MRMGQQLPGARAAMVLSPALFVIAFINASREDAPPERVVPVLALLIVLALAIYIQPVADAALSRASEYAADRYAAQFGAAPELAAVGLRDHPAAAAAQVPVGRPASCCIRRRPSGVPGQCLPSASGPARRTTDRNTSATAMASSA